MLHFDNQLITTFPGDPETGNFVRQVHGALWSSVDPTPVRAPHLLAYSAELAAQLGLDQALLTDGPWLQALAGNARLPGMVAYATRYGGHQFGHWAGQLGDGRAILLGEAVVGNQRHELQLKGAGPTPYARHADGRAVLRSSVREFLCSEAMHHLGIPTTRALSLVGTGEGVMRDMFYDGHAKAEPGAVVCRVAPSFLRFGHFELPAARDEHDLLRQLVAFTIRRDFPAIDADAPDAMRIWFTEVCTRTAALMAHWMRVGFVHGVMNTDNMSILGLTIDYGPYGWIDDFDPGWTPNTTDAEGRRYCFGRQPEIGRWNLERLAAALGSIVDDESLLTDGLAEYDRRYSDDITRHFAAKLGLPHWHANDGALLDRLFELMFGSEADMTDFFRRLGSLDLAASRDEQFTALRACSYDAGRWDAQQTQWHGWLAEYGAATAAKVGGSGTAPAANSEAGIARRQRMDAVNPRYVLRNYLAQQAIDRAHEGDAAGIAELLEVMRRPYTEQPGREAYAGLRPEWARHKPGCSMLSCSS